MVEKLLPGLTVIYVSCVVAIGMNSAPYALLSSIVFTALLAWMYLAHPTDLCREAGITIVILSVVAGGLFSVLLWLCVLAFVGNATRTVGYWIFIPAFAPHLMWTIGWYDVKQSENN